MLFENEVKAAVQYIINGTAALTLFQDSWSYVYIRNGVLT